ncbi:hypothetical protein U1Q18_033503 [Sarracenia purpurea var. burkii]
MALVMREGARMVGRDADARRGAMRLTKTFSCCFGLMAGKLGPLLAAKDGCYTSLTAKTIDTVLTP